MDTVTLNSPCDMHLHLRDGAMMEGVIAFSVSQFSAAVIMPNLLPPLKNTKSVKEYESRIVTAANCADFLPLMTLFYHEGLTKEELTQAKTAGIKIIKLYPRGLTTNSDKGPKQLLSSKNLKIFKMIEDVGMILSLHGESSGFVMDREFEFLGVFEELAKMFPKLRLILEHVSDARSVDVIERYANTFGTITLHHLLFTLDDLMGDKLQPHLFCKPSFKLPRDRDALRVAAFNAHPKFSFGSDSAPHLREDKECPYCAAGVFSAPVLLPALVELFEKNNALEFLQPFLSLNATRIYQFNPPKRAITLVKKPFKVAREYEGVVSFLSEKEISWSIQSSF
ncbi:dihydroorotase [Helicobacter monodelphidis]|uniref:dihydroorotase n=1 Tax=Helicobacter sp. 15-1451 TaxID=2004995 RepID=UPI000DCF2BC2|nr:dihydroorotase [Helicobacter sp. 15-1451]RAX58653.1 dihydroorotase [Helicobacter sp. 15-1451]